MPIKKICQPTSGTTEPSATNTPASATVNAAPTTKIITIKTDVIALEIDTQGATLRNLDLLAYPVEKDNAIVNSLREMVGLPVAEKKPYPRQIV